MEKLTVSVKEWAEIVGCSYAKAYQMTRIEGFPVISLGRKKIIVFEKAKNWLNDNAGNLYV